MASSNTLVSQSGLSVIWSMKASMRSSRTVTPMLSHDRSMARGKRKPPVAESGPGWWWTGRPRPGNWFLVGGAMADDAVKMAGSGEDGLGAREGQLFQLLAPLPLQQPRSGVNRSWAVKCSPLTGATWRRAGCLPGDRWDAGREAGDMRQAPTLCSALPLWWGKSLVARGEIPRSP